MSSVLTRRIEPQMTAGGAHAAAPGTTAAPAGTTAAPAGTVDRLPDFRNPGVMARVLVVVHLGLFLFAGLIGGEPGRYGQTLTESALIVEPSVIIVLVLCYAASPLLAGMAYGQGLAAVAAMVAAVTASLCAVVPEDAAALAPYSSLRAVALSVLCVLLLGEYMRLRNRALSPALAEARLQSLQARIRPHFLFNSLNAVLGVMRSDPRRAERLMEDLADLFRTLMADNTSLVPLSRELEVVQDYLRIEGLRLGERLRVDYRVDPSAQGAQVPPLFLQPLVENAVYHGIEPRLTPGTVELSIRREGDRVHVAVSNPVDPGAAERRGNRMALSNIRERLALHFDAHATLRAGAAGDRYQVSIDLPYRPSGMDRSAHA